ncbi:MAG: hypothetical protein JKY30_04170 [Flavobacteriales bacterium]|nr:hypothetical protein [Flavobacteriales bacterium]
MKTKPLYLIYLQTILFSIFLLITSYFNRFAIDDFHFIGELQTTSFTNIYKHLYFDWHGRWASNFLLIGFLKFNTFPFFLALYNIFSISLLYLGIVRLFNSLNHFYQLNFNKKTILLYGIIAISVLFFCTINASDVWMWYTSSIVYLWSTIALFWGTTIFFKHKKTFIDFAILIISAIYIGGSNEPLTIFIIISLLILLLKKRKKTISVISLFFTLSAFLINYLSPGTLHRDEITPSLSFIDLMLYTGYGSIKFLLFSIYKTFIPALFIAVNFYLLGQKLGKPIFQNFKPLPELIKSLIIIGVTIFLNQIIVIYALGGLAPDRSSITSSIIIAIILIRYLFLLGNYHQKNILR